MADSCKFGDFKNETIRDWLVIGVCDGKLSEWLQLEPNLMLVKAEKLICQHHAVAEQALIETTHVHGGHYRCNAVQRHAHRKQQHYPARKKPTAAREPSITGPKPPLSKCRRCGRGSHPRQQCPTCDVIYNRCKRVGHYSSQCLSKTMAEVTNTRQPLDTTEDQDNDVYSDPVYLNTVTDQ